MWWKLKIKITPGELKDWAYFTLYDRWAQFVSDFYNEYYDKFSTWPASCGKHHSYEGGLFTHSFTAAKQAAKICECYPNVNKNVTVVATFLHDVGKMLTYDKVVDVEKNVSFKKNRWNMLHHHIPLGYRMLMNYIDRYNISEEEKLLFGHCILAHHGRLEWHSPVEPAIPEAQIVHAADMTDAYIMSYYERGKLHGGD